MPESTNPNPKPIPENYRRIEGSERRLARGERWVRGADPNQALPVIIRVKAGAGQAGLDRLATFARAQGLEVVGISVREYIVVVSGTVVQIGEVFAVEIAVHESPAGICRSFAGHLHLPAGLAEIVEHVWGLVEREIGNIEKVIGSLLGQGGKPGGNEGSGAPRQVFDLKVPKSGPSGTVNPDEFSMVQVFDVGWLSDPGYQRMLDNLAASPVAFKTVRVMKVFTNGTTPPETGIAGTTTGGTVWPAGLPSSSISFENTLNLLAELTSRGLIPFIVLGFFPDGIYNGTSYQSISPLPGPTGPSSINPILPADWTQILKNWTSLVQAFVAQATTDSRFTPTIKDWWFEVWNEPDNPNASFWGPDGGTGVLTYYQELYRATSAAVAGYNIQLGGPTIMGPSVIGTNTTIPGTTATLMSGFIDFVTGVSPIPPDPVGTTQQCNFLSFHAKGSWSNCLNGAVIDIEHGDEPVPVVNGGPVLQSAIDAADQTASFATKAGLTHIVVINDEADMRVYFDVPFRPRMTEQYAAWLTALMIAYDSLSSEYAPIRCRIGSDNAELPLVGYQQAPGPVDEGPTDDDPSFAPTAFGQQRTIMTAASAFDSGTCPIDLLKVPVYNFYELLRLLGDQHGVFLTGGNDYYPNNSDLFHMISWEATHIGSVFCVYPPNPPSGPSKTPWPLDYSILGITWSAINWYQFQIDGTHSNGFNAAGGPAAEPPVSFCVPDDRQTAPASVVPLPLAAATVKAVRSAQDLSVVAAKRDASPDFNISVSIPANTTTVFWITEYTKNVPDTPAWDTSNPFTVDTTPYGKNVVLRWQPSTDPTFYSYEVYRVEGTDTESPSPSDLISPNPLAPPPATTLRAAFWVDTNPGTDTTYTYWILARSPSGFPSGFSAPQPVVIPA
jgi:hypothetical protein